MPATFTWQGCDETGADAVTATPFDIGVSGASVLMTQSRTWSVTPASSPIPAGQASIERHVRARYSGTFSNILPTSVKIWRSDSSTLATGVALRCGGLSDGSGVAYAVPSTTANGDAAVPTSEPASGNVSIDGTGSTRYSPGLASGLSRWLRLQVGTTISTPAGNFSNGDPQAVLTMKYTEN